MLGPLRAAVAATGRRLLAAPARLLSATPAAPIARPAALSALVHQPGPVSFPLVAPQGFLKLGAQRRGMAVFTSPYSDVDIPDNMSLVPFLRQRWAEKKDKTALTDTDSGKTVTFGELSDRIDAASAALQKLGFGEGDVLAIHLRNCLEFPIAFLACAQLGGVITTSNPMYTSRELHNQLVDSNAKLILSSTEFQEQVDGAVKDSAVTKAFFVEDAESFLTAPLEAPFTAPALSDPKNMTLALPYSSGTTGLPKGVQLSHYNVVANICQFSDCKEISNWDLEKDVVLGILPFFHIYGMTVIMLSAVYQGVPVVTMSAFEPMKFLETMQSSKITVAYLVPPIILFLAKHPVVEKFDLKDLRDIFSGAAPLDAETQGSAAQRLNAMVRQGYGMTELSPVSHSSPSDTGGKPGSSGCVLPRGECKVVDEQGKELEPNSTGELWYRGPNVMLGYFNRPEATAETLTEDGWLKTGDIAYIDEDGYLFIVDRAKELIKVKGLQVAPAELEGLLVSCPEVADAAVIGVDDARSGQVPKAFVVRSESGKDCTEDDIKNLVNNQVAAYKRLQHVEFIEAVPKSPAGKILRRQLKQD